MSQSLRRVAVVGPIGCGKTTFARELSERLGLPFVELDLLKYGPGWKEVPDDAFWDAVATRAGGESWVMDGNYGAVRDLVWIRAQTLVWLDFSLAVTLSRLLRRTMRRLLSGEEFTNGNREELRRILGRRSILVWAVRSHRARRRLYEQLIAGPRYSHLEVVRLHSPSEADCWLRQFPAVAAVQGEPCTRSE